MVECWALGFEFACGCFGVLLAFRLVSLHFWDSVLKMGGTSKRVWGLGLSRLGVGLPRSEPFILILQWEWGF